VLLVLIDLISGGSLRAIVRGSAAPVSKVGTTITSQGFFSSRSALQAENEKLRDEVAKLTLHAALLASMERENQELRALVALSEDLSGVGARVTSSYRASPYGTFHIDAGSNKGIAQGHLVLADDPLALEGQGGGNARGEISRALEIAEGEVVEAPNLRGLPIGVVGRVEEDAASATKRVFVGLPVNLSALRFVHVVPR
jgi:cell shape-determining protein MreC